MNLKVLATATADLGAIHWIYWLCLIVGLIAYPIKKGLETSTVLKTVPDKDFAWSDLLMDKPMFKSFILNVLLGVLLFVFVTYESDGKFDIIRGGIIITGLISGHTYIFGYLKAKSTAADNIEATKQADEQLAKEKQEQIERDNFQESTKL